MIMKRNKIISAILAPALIIVFSAGCDKTEDESITYELNDVSSKLSGFGSEITGPGAPLTVNGSELNEVVRICVASFCVPKKLFTTGSESSITFSVPQNTPLGDQRVMLVYPGSDRAFKTISVVALPSIIAVVPTRPAVGEIVTAVGQNFDIVTAVSVGTVSAAIISKTSNAVSFALPEGASGKVTLTSPATTAVSAVDVVPCASPTSDECAPGLNPNAGFEIGTGDNFDSWNKFNGGTKIVATTAIGSNEVFRGTRAMKVIRDGTLIPATDQWRIQLASNPVPVDNGASYTVSAWVRASAAGGAMRFSNQDAPQYGPDTQITTTWSKITWTFTANATQKRIVLDMNGGPVTTFFIDDVKMIKN
jgi:hypothetical protein